jgi:hypothetical protein
MKTPSDVADVLPGVFNRLGKKPGEILLPLLVVNSIVIVLTAIAVAVARPDTSTNANSIPAWLYGAGLLVFIVYMLIYSLALATSLAGGTYLQERPIREAFKRALTRLFPFVIVYLLVSLSVVFGTLLLIIPGVFLAILFALALPVAVLEDRGVIESLSRSVELTAGHRLNIFLSGLLLAMMVVAFSCLTGCIAACLGPLAPIINIIIGMLTSGLLVAWMLENYERITQGSVPDQTAMPENRSGPSGYLPPPPAQRLGGQSSSPGLPPPPAAESSYFPQPPPAAESSYFPPPQQRSPESYLPYPPPAADVPENLPPPPGADGPLPPPPKD